MRLTFFLTLTCLLSTLSSCNKQKNKSTQEIRLTIPTDPISLDPRVPSDAISSSILSMCFEGLTRQNSQGNVILALAENIDISEDKMHYTITIKPSKWSDGAPVTAYDFEYAWKSLFHPSFISHFPKELFALQNAKKIKEGILTQEHLGVKAIHAHLLSIELEKPLPSFVKMLSLHYFYPVPSHVVRRDLSWAVHSGPNYVCNGPFLLKKWKHDQLLLLHKNPTYWNQEQVKISKLLFHVIPNKEVELSLFENQELDWLGSPLSSLSLDALASLSQVGEISNHPLAGTYYYLFNTKCPPFHNANMRRAFALAINRQEIIQNLLQGPQIPATSLVPPLLYEKPSPPLFADGDLLQAKKLFRKALLELGCKKEDLPPIVLSYNAEGIHQKIAEAIQQQWNLAFHIQVQLEKKEWKVLLNEIKQHQFQMARMGFMAQLKDPCDFLLACDQKACHWENPLFHQLLEEASSLEDATKKEALLRKAEKILIEDMPIIPLYFYTGTSLKNPALKGVHLSELSGLDFTQAYWDEH